MPSLPLGLISIASFLQAHGHRVRIYERSSKKTDISTEIKTFNPDIIGISTLSFLSCIDAKKLTSQIRSLTKAPVVWGGQAPSSLPEMILREASPDFVMLGEGEITWMELVSAIENGEDIFEIQGLAYIKNGEFICNPVRPVADLMKFPDMDWGLVEPERYFSTFFNCTKMLYLHSSKGCPASCIFCANKQFHQGCNRCRDPKQVMRDIDYFVQKCGANGIYFSDELFCPRRELRTELCNMLIEKNYDLVWGCQMRLGVLNEDDIKLMFKAGCRWILFGIESGSPERIKTIKKNIDLSLAKKTVEWCENAGITVQASFIIGFPNETEEEMKKTVSFAKSLPASLIDVNILFPAPNSDIYEMWKNDYPQYKIPSTIKEWAKKVDQNVSDSMPWNFSFIPKKDLKVVHHYFQWKDFIGKSSVQHDSYGIVKKMAHDTFNRIFLHGFRGFFFGTFVSVKQFSTVFFYSHFFSKTKKKYGLD